MAERKSKPKAKPSPKGKSPGEGKPRERRPVGRPAKRLIVDGKWKDAVDRALDKKCPKDGWPVDKKSEKTEGSDKSEDSEE